MFDNQLPMIVKHACLLLCYYSGDVMEPEDSLLCISLWHYLQSLVLAGIPSILHGYSLISITKGCTMLTSLSLSHLGPYPYDQCFFIQNLCQAMTYAKQLRDFR